MESRDRLLKFARAKIDRTNRGVLLLPRRMCYGEEEGRKRETRGGWGAGCVGSRSRRGDSVEMNGKGLTLRNITPLRRPHPRFPAQGCDPFKHPWSKQQQQQKNVNAGLYKALRGCAERGPVRGLMCSIPVSKSAPDRRGFKFESRCRKSICMQPPSAEPCVHSRCVRPQSSAAAAALLAEELNGFRPHVRDG